MTTSSIRLGVDIGGTFTDTVLVDTDSELFSSAKTPTTPEKIKAITMTVMSARTKMRLLAELKDSSVTSQKERRLWASPVNAWTV